MKSRHCELFRTLSKSKILLLSEFQTETALPLGTEEMGSIP